MKTRRQAFTLMEVLIFTAIGSIILAAVGTLFLYTARSMVGLSNYNDLNQNSRNALDILSRDVRGARSVTSFSANSLVFQDIDNDQLSYIYNPSDKTFRREKDGDSKILLTGCDYLKFQVYQRNPSNNFTFYPTANPAFVKLIDVSWKCSRKILGSDANSESVQTAKIVIRN